MKFIDTLSALSEFKRIKRYAWQNRFIIRSMVENETLIHCDFQSLIMDRFKITFEDLIADDWEILK
jgi:hypothetical protein